MLLDCEAKCIPDPGNPNKATIEFSGIATYEQADTLSYNLKNKLKTNHNIDISEPIHHHH